MRNQRGITLIALVITIIVLLILAGVSIAMLTGDNGILTKSTQAKRETEMGEIADKINLAINTEYANILADKAMSGDDEAIATVNGISTDDFDINPGTVGANGTTLSISIKDGGAYDQYYDDYHTILTGKITCDANGKYTINKAKVK